MAMTKVDELIGSDVRKAVQKAVAPIILAKDFRAIDWESRCIEDVAIAALKVIPVALTDLQAQVAGLREALRMIEAGHGCPSALAAQALAQDGKDRDDG